MRILKRKLTAERLVLNSRAGHFSEVDEVTADLLRHVILKRGHELGPYGLRVRGANISCPLDLSACRIAFPLQFLDCVFSEPLTLEGAELDSLTIVGSRPINEGATSTIPGILGNGANIRRNLVLSRTLIAGSLSSDSSVHRTAAVWLTESSIGGRLLAGGTSIQTDGDRAIQADRMSITGDVRLIRGFRANAEIRLIGAQLGGSLDLSGAQLLSHSGRALDIAEATIGGSIFLTDSPHHAPKVDGRIEMGRTLVNGRILIRSAIVKAPEEGVGRHLYNAPDPGRRLAMVAPGLTVRGDLSIYGKSRIEGGLALAGAVLDGGLILHEAVLDNKGDLALDLPHAQLGAQLSANERVEINGTINLNSASIAGDLNLDRILVQWPADRYCVTAVRTVVHGGVFIRLSRIGSEDPEQVGSTGGMTFRGAEISGQLDAEGATIISPGDNALNLHQARVGGNLRLCAGFRSNGVVNLNRAVIDGRLRCDGGTFSWCHRDRSDSRTGEPNERNAAVEAISAIIRGGIDLSWDVRGAVDLTEARTSFLADRPAKDWPSGATYLSGFTYERYSAPTRHGMGEWSWRTRADWLAASDPAPAHQAGDPGPWEQAARTLKNHGDSAGSEHLLMEYLRNKRRRRAGLLRYRGVRSADLIFNDWFRGYGYRPLRALWPLICIVILVWLSLQPIAFVDTMRATDPTGIVYTPRGQLSIIEQQKVPEQQCGDGKVRCFSPMLYAIDTVVPIVDLKQRSIWSPSTDAGGEILLWWLTAATLSGWAISSLLVVGLARTGSRSLEK